MLPNELAKEKKKTTVFRVGGLCHFRQWVRNLYKALVL